jgi:hypothetical protein
VLALLLEGLSSNETWQMAVQRRDFGNRADVAFTGLMPARSALLPDSETKVVPIRFPEPRYNELKAWCEEHQFPMAAVVRGLVERFLDSPGLP